MLSLFSCIDLQLLESLVEFEAFLHINVFSLRIISRLNYDNNVNLLAFSIFI